MTLVDIFGTDCYKNRMYIFVIVLQVWFVWCGCKMICCREDLWEVVSKMVSSS